jgi:predicted ATP-dependent endonuclease of OLD family
MQLTSIRVRNFRTVEDEQNLNLRNGLTIVGPNNSGKTNLLKAVELLFTGDQNKFDYTRSNDLTFWVNRKQTTLVATFDGMPENNRQIYNNLDNLHEILDINRSGTSFKLYLSLTKSNNPIYKFFPNEQRPSDKTLNAKYSRIKNDLVRLLLSKFSLYYVPSAKSMESLYDDIIVPVTKDTAANALKPSIEKLESRLNSISQNINKQLELAGLENITASFRFPDNSVRNLISGFDLRLEDPSETSVFRKGMGIQSIAIIASFMWITKQEKKKGQSVIWLLEEPESYLHPELSESCKTMLDKLGEESLVINTTHSIGFVPSDPNLVVGTKLVGDDPKKRTEVSTFRNYYEATKTLRNSLGVKFSDFYNLGDKNVLVEGPSDRELFKWFFDLTKDKRDDKFSFPTLRSAQFFDFGGVKHLEGFLRATWRFIHKERATVSVFDGDDAGTKVRGDLQRYFGQKEIRFENNKDFVSVRKGFAIEGLFPDEWIKDAYEQNPEWFIEYSVDATDNLEPFRVRDRNKKTFRKYLVERAEKQSDLQWTEQWVAVCNTVNDALEWQIDRLKSSD